jgi:hypothetical protein
MLGRTDATRISAQAAQKTCPSKARWRAFEGLSLKSYAQNAGVFVRMIFCLRDYKCSLKCSPFFRAAALNLN